MLTLFAPLPQRPPRTKEVRLAEIYDEHVHPLWGARFSSLLLRAFVPKPNAQVLELGCRSGAATTELLARSDADSRVIAVDPVQAMVDRVRARLLPEGSRSGPSRLFLRTQELGGRLPFADGTYDVLVANLSVLEAPDWPLMLPDLARLVRPGGTLHVALALRGTWAEALDLFDEALLRMDREEGHAALRAYVDSRPDAETVTRCLTDAGLRDVTHEIDTWDLLFKSAREFFYAPLIEHGPLPKWKEIAGRGQAMHEVFFDVKQAIDTYYAGRAFAVNVVAGCFSGRKPLPEETAAQADEEPEELSPDDLHDVRPDDTSAHR